jgi:putative heme degradation protein
MSLTIDQVTLTQQVGLLEHSTISAASALLQDIIFYKNPQIKHKESNLSNATHEKDTTHKMDTTNKTDTTHKMDTTHKRTQPTKGHNPQRKQPTKRWQPPRSQSPKGINPQKTYQSTKR